MITDFKINNLTEKIELAEEYNIVVEYLLNRFVTPHYLEDLKHRIPPELYNKFKTTYYKTPESVHEICITDKNKFVTYLFVMSCLLRNNGLRYIINEHVYTWDELLKTFINFFDYDALFQYIELNFDIDFQRIVEDNMRERLIWSDQAVFPYFEFE